MGGEDLKGRIEFQFEYLAMLDAESLHIIFMAVDSRTLAVALKDAYAGRTLADIVRANLSPEAFSALLQQMKDIGSVPVSEVRKQQWRVVAIVRELSARNAVSVPEHFYFPSDDDILQYCDFMNTGRQRRRAFKMEDVALLDDRSIQHLLFGIDDDDLVKSLVYASQKARQAVFRNMTHTAVEQMEKAIIAAHACPTEEIVASLKKLIFAAEKLADEHNLHYIDELMK
ncbi:MAG TPA: hypothetical protein DDW78_04330 [Treponema sp.]|nr:hypothetical protein [Treponema sp.]